MNVVGKKIMAYNIIMCTIMEESGTMNQLQLQEFQFQEWINAVNIQISYKGHPTKELFGGHKESLMWNMGLSLTQGGRRQIRLEVIRPLRDIKKNGREKM